MRGSVGAMNAELSRPDGHATVQSGRKQAQSRICTPGLSCDCQFVQMSMLPSGDRKQYFTSRVNSCVMNHVIVASGHLVTFVLRHDQRRSQDYCSADVTRYILRDFQKPTRFSGGGVVAEMLYGLLKRTTFTGEGGGCSSRTFP